MDLSNLVKKAQKGDKKAFEQVYNLLSSKIYKFIFYKLNNKEDAEDVSLETWAQIIKSLKNYNGSVQFNTWTYAIAKNCINKYLQEKYELQEYAMQEEIETLNLNPENKDENLHESTLVTSQVEEFDEEVHLEKESKLKTFEDKIAKLFNMLKPRDSKVLELRFLKGYKSEEVAKELNLSVSNVKIIQLRSLRKLQKLNLDEL